MQSDCKKLQGAPLEVPERPGEPPVARDVQNRVPISPTGTASSAPYPGAATGLLRLRLERVVVTGILAATIGAAYLYGLGHWPPIDPDEGRNAEIAREMLAGGSWALPHLNDLPFLDKPPALFWMIALAFRLGGQSEITARLPSVLSALALMLLTFDVGRLLLGTRRGALAALVLVSSPLVIIYGRLTIFDMPFTMCLNVSGSFFMSVE